jgi:hypothetical protein
MGRGRMRAAALAPRPAGAPLCSDPRGADVPTDAERTASQLATRMGATTKPKVTTQGLCHMVLPPTTRVCLPPNEAVATRTPTGYRKQESVSCCGK